MEQQKNHVNLVHPVYQLKWFVVVLDRARRGDDNGLLAGDAAPLVTASEPGPATIRCFQGAHWAPL